MKILAVGGGSGGHVTPVVAVLVELKKRHPRAEIRFWCDNKFFEQARAVVGNFDNNIRVDKILAGKFRRYHHLSALRQLFWPSLVVKNVGDAFLVISGFIQSLFKLIIWRPDVVFAKGGYVCLPVGIATYILRIPLVIHDSDAHPGLTNRILGRFATKIATGAPLEHYNYKTDRTRYVGIPISPEFHKFTDSERQSAKKQWGIRADYPLVVVTGGGLGATRINDAVAEALDDILKFCSLILISGTNQYDELRSITPPNSDRFQLHSFISKDMATLLGAADVVIARAGATTILELAALSKPTILVPNAKLTGGHQIKNATVYLKEDAVIAVDEDKMVDEPQILVSAIRDLIDNPGVAADMAERFSRFAKKDAASDVADMIISCVK